MSEAGRREREKGWNTTTLLDSSEYLFDKVLRAKAAEEGGVEREDARGERCGEGEF